MVFKYMREKVFLRFLLSYICILIIPALIVGFALHETYRTLEDEITASNLSVLKQTNYILDERLKRIDPLIIQLNWNPKIRQVLDHKGNKEATIYPLRQAFYELVPYMENNETMFLYFKDLGVLMSPKEVYTRMDIIYGTLFSYGNYDLEEAKRHLFMPKYFKEFFPSEMLHSNEIDEKYLLCVQTLPIEVGGVGAANLLYFIDEKQIEDLLMTNHHVSGGWSYICDDKGKVLCSFGNTERLMPVPMEELDGSGSRLHKGDMPMLITYTQSDYNGWYYVSATPKEHVYSKMADLRQMTTFLMSLVVLLGGGLAYILSYRNYKPINEISHKLKRVVGKQEQETGNDYVFLNDGLEHLLRDQLPIIKNTIYQKLFRGEIEVLHDSCFRQAYLEFNTWEGYGILLIGLVEEMDSLSAGGIENVTLKKTITQEIMESSLSISPIIVDMDIHRLAILVSRKDLDDARSLEKELDTIVQELRNTYNIYIKIGGGCTYTQLEELYKSYYEAVEALTCCHMKSGHSIMWFKNIPEVSYMYVYTIENETHLIHAIRSGSSEKVEALLQELYRRNIENKALNGEMLKQFYYELKGTLYKINEQEQIPLLTDDDFKSLDTVYKEGVWQHTFEELFTLVKKATKKSDGLKRSHNGKLLDEIMLCIHQEFCKQDMGLGLLSDKLGVSQVYLSQFFKEQTGDNFSHYLERLRIKKALYLLDHTKKPITDIARETGYNSSHTFRRAFKRIQGQVPSDRRGKSV